MHLKQSEKIVRIAVIVLALYLVGFGIAMALFPIKPFWNDEWRLLYNIKFKTIPQLWGRLDLLQECPRLYLSMIKVITSFFDYSYTSLRTPALVIGCINILFLFRLRKKLLGQQPIYGYLWVLIILSSQTLTDYLVQVKHYEMEIFACLLALWQLLTLLQLSDAGMQANKGKYLLLCVSCAVVPYFSYMYPIAIAPVFPVILLHLFTRRHQQEINTKRMSTAWLLLPLIVIAVSVLIFYLVDVRHMMADKRMYQSYLRVLHNESGEKRYLSDFWNLFALVGSGFVYEIVFGVLGIAAFVYGIYKLVAVKKYAFSKEGYLVLYSVLLVLITLYLFVSGNLLGGVARLTSYTVPAIAFLIVTLISHIQFHYGQVKVAILISLLLFLGLAGNIISTCIAGNFIYPEYQNRITTYRNTAKALQEARLRKIPLLYTSGIDGDKKNNDAPAPGKIATNTITPEQIAGVDNLCAEVILKVNPEYKVWDTIPVYEIPDTKWLHNYMQQLPPQYTTAITGDGVNYISIQR